jgi:3-hydroxybutyryl-CoA dehydrogenase
MAEITTLAVIGAGITGRGIAQAAALGGYRTILEDILPTSLRRAEDEFRDILEKAIATGKISRRDAVAVLERLQYASSVEEAARQADLVIEAVPDEWESKSEIFILLDKICKPQTILVSSTAMLSVTEIASVTYRASKILGMHFSNPVHKMKRLELVRTAETEDEALAACREVARRMRKEVVVFADGVSGVRDPLLRPE